MAAEPTYIVTTGDYIGEWMEDHHGTKRVRSASS